MWTLGGVTVFLRMCVVGVSKVEWMVGVAGDEDIDFGCGNSGTLDTTGD
jgi:hypothetical protein